MLRLADLRHAWRALRRAPGYLAAVALTLAVGIGGTTALFGVVDRVLLRELPYRDPVRLVRVDEWPLADALVERIAARRDLYAGVAGVTWSYDVSALVGAGSGPTPLRIPAAAATGNLFDVLGVPAALGRAITPDDARPDALPVAVLAERFWRERYGGDPGVVGRDLVVDGVRRRIVGVMPARLRLPDASVAVWIPTRTDASDFVGYWWSWRLNVVARLAPGVTPAQASAATRTLVMRAGQEEFPQKMNADFGAALVARPLQEAIVGGVRSTLWLLLGATAVVLVVAVVNATGLALVRAAGRERELTVRAAVGAGRARLVGQLVAEGVVVAAIAAAAGGALAWAITRAVAAVVPRDLPRVEELGVDGRAFGVACLVALVSGVAAALVPALGASRVDVRGALAGAGRGATAGAARRRLLDRLVVAQLALGVTLAAGAGLLVASLGRLDALDPGFRPARATVAEVPLPSEPPLAVDVPLPARDDHAARRDPALRNDPIGRARARADAEAARTARARAFHEALLARVRALPGVEHAALASSVPFVGSGGRGVFDLEAHPRAEGGPWKAVAYATLSPGALRALGVPLVAGRDFTDADRAGAPHVALVDVAAVRRYWPEFAAEPGRAVGQRVRKPNEGAPWLTVVGVVGSVRRDSLPAEPLPSLYLPIGQEAPTEMRVVVRGALDAATFATALRTTVAALDPTIPVGTVRPLGDHVADSTRRVRFVAGLLAAFALAAVGLGAVGVYGVTAYAVARRRREMGVRLALGATATDVRRLVLGDAGKLALAGLAIGLVGATAGRGVVRAFLYGVSPVEPLVLLPIAAGLGGVVLLATWLPARRAAGTDPAAVLRAD